MCLALIMPLNHSDIISLAEYLGYPTDKDGMCYGLSGMGIQALLSNDLATFDQRFKIIGEHIDRTSVKDLAEVIQGIERKRVARIKEFKEQLLKDLHQNVSMCDKDFYSLLEKEKENDFVKKFNIQRSSVDKCLSDAEKKLVDIRAFIEGAVFNFRPTVFKSWFVYPAAVNQQNLELSFTKILPDELIKKNSEIQQGNRVGEKSVVEEKDETLITKLKSWSGLYDEQELTTYSSLLRTGLPNTVFQLLSSKHALTVFFDSQANCWRLLDELPSRAYYSDEDFAKAVLDAFGEASNVAFSTEIYCKKSDINELSNKLSVLSQNPLWNKLYELRQKQSLSQDNIVNLLYIAAQNDHLDLVNSLLQCSNLNVNQRMPHGTTSFGIAVQYGYINVIKAMLNYKTLNVNQLDKHGRTPLYVAVQKEHLNVVNALLECKELDVNKADKEGRTPLCVAIRYESINVVNALLECKKLDVNKALPNGYTPLLLAVEKANVILVKALLKTGRVNLNIGLQEGAITAIYLAAQKGQIEIMSELLKSPLSNDILNRPIKANIDVLLDCAKKENREAEVKQLLQSKGITSTELKGFTPLFAAIFWGHTEIVKMLIEQEVDLKRNADGQISGLEFAQAMNRKDIIVLLTSALEKTVGHAEKDKNTDKSNASNSKISISLSDLSLKSGSEQGVPGEKGKNLGVESTKRAAFFSQRPLAHAALTRLPQNPLFIEDLSGPTELKEPLGEYFIPPEEFAKLIAARIMKYEQRNLQGQHFDTKNIFIIDNNLNALNQKLRESQNILAKDSGNLKINYIDENHQVAIYLRNVGGTVYCYFSDSQAATDCSKSLFPSIIRHFPGAQIIIGPDIQRDYYGCFNFGEKSTQLFMKEGERIFPHIEKNKEYLTPVTEKINGVVVRYSLLSQEGLMPKLLKLSQTLNAKKEVNLSSQTLNTIVSQQKNETLKNYLAKNTIEVDNKKINATILMKKYKRVDELEDITTDTQVLRKAESIYFAPPISYLIQDKRLEQLKCLLSSQEKVLTAKVSQECRLTPILFSIRELITAMEIKQRSARQIQIAMHKIQNIVLQLEVDTINAENLELSLDENERWIEQQNLKLDQAEVSVQGYLRIIEELAKRMQAKDLLLDNEELGMLVYAIENNALLRTSLLENETVSNYFKFLQMDVSNKSLLGLSMRKSP